MPRKEKPWRPSKFWDDMRAPSTPDLHEPAHYERIHETNAYLYETYYDNCPPGIRYNIRNHL